MINIQAGIQMRAVRSVNDGRSHLPSFYSLVFKQMMTSTIDHESWLLLVITTIFMILGANDSLNHLVTT